MDIPIDAEVFCTDGFCGRSTHVVLRPKTEEVTHLVVKENESPHREVLIPVSAIAATTPDSINLRYTRHEIVGRQPFIETFVYPDVETLPVKHEAIPAGELAVRRGASVQATDGHVGRVDEFLVDPENDHITHLVLREGHVWAQKDVTIPISEIEHIEENTVYLKIDKRGVGALPVIPLKRKRL